MAERWSHLEGRKTVAADNIEGDPHPDLEVGAGAGSGDEEIGVEEVVVVVVTAIVIGTGEGLEVVVTAEEDPAHRFRFAERETLPLRGTPDEETISINAQVPPQALVVEQTEDTQIIMKETEIGLRLPLLLLDADLDLLHPKITEPVVSEQAIDTLPLHQPHFLPRIRIMSRRT